VTSSESTAAAANEEELQWDHSPDIGEGSSTMPYGKDSDAIELMEHIVSQFVTSDKRKEAYRLIVMYK